MIIWVTGLSGAGKTTIGDHLYKKIKKEHANTVFIDGDIIRGIFDVNLGFSLEDRERNALRYFNLCKMLDGQGINVVCCILLNTKETQELNRKEYKNYFEIFIDVSMEELFKRDSKGLYKKALNGEINNVVGVDIDFVPPQNPDHVIDNNTFVNLDTVVNDVVQRLPKSGFDTQTPVHANDQ